MNIKEYVTKKLVEFYSDKIHFDKILPEKTIKLFIDPSNMEEVRLPVNEVKQGTFEDYKYYLSFIENEVLPYVNTHISSSSVETINGSVREFRSMNFINLSDVADYVKNNEVYFYDFKLNTSIDFELKDLVTNIILYVSDV